MKLESLQLTQRMMAVVSKEHASTINRYITSNNIQHIDTGSQRNLRYSLKTAQEVLKYYVSDRYQIDKKVWGFYNFKGGTGKTSLCFQVSTLLAIWGYKVLVIDVDPQGNLTSSLGLNISDKFLTLYDVILKNIPPTEAIVEIFPGYHCIPSNISCSRFDMEISMMGRREEQFKLKLGALKDHYDVILFDTNPNISYIIRNLTTFADMICVPCETQPYSIAALNVLFEDMQAFTKMMDINPPEIIVVPNKYEDRYGTAAEAMAVLRQNFSKYLVPDFAVRRAEDFNIAAKEGLPLPCVAKKNSIALEDIVELGMYLVQKSKNN
ncbi:MAG TPA: ParA family protein [Alphaproteobacteria bacterium]|nr:ParA family protein [Alphaproteobacteria bacterium]